MTAPVTTPTPGPVASPDVADPGAGVRRVLAAASAVAALGVAVLVAGLCWPVLRGDPPRLAVVTGTSMRPTLGAGDLVLVRAGDRYRRGDVVTFRVPSGQPAAGVMVVHRVTGRRDGRLTTRGDANRQEDPWTLAPTDVSGRVVIHLAGAGRALLVLRSPVPVLAAAVGLAVAAMVAGPRRGRRT